MVVSTASIERGGAGGARREVRKREREENANAVALSESGYGFLHTRSFNSAAERGGGSRIPCRQSIERASSLAAHRARRKDAPSLRDPGGVLAL
tara:strand:- start:315 stop:596 length:282 start_codon:yes stop_codon:yes gene_type:complete